MTAKTPTATGRTTADRPATQARPQGTHMQIRTSIGRRAMALWRQITPCGVTSGGRLSNQFAEQIDGPASGDMSHVKGPGLLLMSQEVELRSPFARVRPGSSVMPGRSGAAQSASCGRMTRTRRAVIRARGRSSIHAKEKIYSSIP
jgi:hypothetical protein